MASCKHCIDAYKLQQAHFAERQGALCCQHPTSHQHARLLLPFLTGDAQPQHTAGVSGGRGDGSSRVWGAVVNFERMGKKDNTDGGDGESHKKRKEGPYIVDVLVNCSSDSIPGTGPKRYVIDHLGNTLKHEQSPKCHLATVLSSCSCFPALKDLDICWHYFWLYT